MPYSVFLLDETMPVPSAALGKLVHTVLGGVVYDHIRSINTHHGWIARDLSREQAEQLLAELKAGGHGAILKDEQDLVGAGEVVLIRRGEVRADALAVEVGLLGEMRPLPWESLSLISIGRVRAVTQKLVQKTKRKIGFSRAGLAMGVPVPVTKTKTTTSTEKQVEESLLVQLAFAEEGVLREIRPSSFDFSYLGERRRPTRAENIRLFLSDLVRCAKSVAWTEMARDLAEGGTGHTFQGDKDMLRFTHWRVETTFVLG